MPPNNQEVQKMLLESLSKAAANNHGLSLQPAQVHELMDALGHLQINQVSLKHRLDVAIKLVTLMLRTVTNPVEFSENLMQQASEGFWVFYNQEQKTIQIGLGQEVPKEVRDAATYEAVPMDMPEMPVQGNDVRTSEVGVPPLPENIDGAGISPQDDNVETAE